MENEEMTNDAAVARDFYERLYGMTFRLFLDANGEPDDDNGIELRLAATVGEKALFETADHSALVPATTVAELRAEVECLRVELAGSQERALMVLRAKDDWMERANKAERRVADFVWRIENEAHQFVSPEGLIYLNYLKESITKESP